MKESKVPRSMTRFARTQTLARLETLAKEWKRASVSPHDEETIHDFRVAIRRFVQCLKLFQAFFRAGAISKIRKPLKKLLDRCGDVRNYDIALELLREAGFEHDPAAADLRRMRRRRERELERRLIRSKSRQRSKDWRAQLKTGPESGGEPWDSRATVSENASRILPAMAAEFFTAGTRAALPDASHETMHTFRLLAKRLRYTLEVFSPVYGQELNRDLAAIRELQDRLGAINDCVASRRLIKRNSKADRAIRLMVPARETEFRAYWEREFSPESAAAWDGWLASAKQKERGVNIYILRHAEAEPASARLRDADRGLTPQGRRAVERTLKAARRTKLAPDAIFTSPLLRARQTAEAASSVLECTEVRETKHLMPTAPPALLWKELGALKNDGVVVLVGHEPQLSRVIGFLLESPVVVDLKKGALVRIETRSQHGPPRGVLKWMLTPRLARSSN